MKSGLIRIQRGDAGSVIVRGLLRAEPSFLSWSDPDQVQRLASNPPIEQDGNTIRIGDVADRWLLRRVHFLVEITAPAETSVRAMADSADVRVEGIHGPVDCETDSGEIQIANIGAQISAKSDSGSISIRQAGGPIDAHTDSGDIEAVEIGGGIDAHTDSGKVRLSQTAVAPIYARSDSGPISIQLADGGYTVRVSSDGAQIDIPAITQVNSSDREMEGVIRGGGSIVNIETDSGNVKIV